MNIINFTPISALLGGIIIGFAVLLFFLFNGRLIGISGIASNFITQQDKRFDNFLFLIGLVLGPFVYKILSNKEIDFIVDKNPQKWGKYAPGSRIKIQSIDTLYTKKPDFIVILPWNLKNEIKDELKFTKNWGAKLVCALPSLEIIS